MIFWRFLFISLHVARGMHLTPLEDPNKAESERCLGTLGNWCENYLKQTPLTWKATFTMCLGSTGVSCSEPELRPCTDRFREKFTDPVTSVHGLKGGWATASRCAGVCDENTGHCYCSGKLGRINAVDAPPGSPPIKRGRLLPRNFYAWRDCAPQSDENGAMSFGGVSYDLLFGAGGMCNLEEPDVPVCRHPCLDDMGGHLCDDPKLPTCISQCNGHGDCNLGFCKCHEGYYGHDCAQLKAGATPRDKVLHPNEEPYAKGENAMDPPPRKGRKSPLIYIYDLPTIFNSRLLQYKTGVGECCHRYYDDNNKSKECSFTFAMETALHELIAQSDHRTFDPKEADYFYMPVYASCYIMNIWGFADFPWFYGVAGQKPAHFSNMMLQAKRYVEQAHPYWNASGGADHIFFFTFDEASCYVPAELRNSTILTHWGETRIGEKAKTSSSLDDYSRPWIVPELSNLTWQYILDENRPCFDPVKDLVIPALRPMNYLSSPMVGYFTHNRWQLLFFRGALRLPNQLYSQGIRQELFRLHSSGRWREKYNIFIGDGVDPPGDYSELLASSIFCAVLPGEGYSTRATDAITNGCIPVVIQDGIHAEFETVIDWGEFGVRINQSDIAHIPEILMAFSEEQIETMQKNLAKIWQRFVYTSLPLVNKLTKDGVEFAKRIIFPDAPKSLPESTTSINFDQDDAFDTIMGFLHHRIPYTRSVESKLLDETRTTTLEYLEMLVEFDDDLEDESYLLTTHTRVKRATYRFHPVNDSRIIGRRKRLRQRKKSHKRLSEDN